MKQTTEQLIEDFLAKGKQIEVLPSAEYVNKNVIGNLNRRPVTLMALQEAELMFGERNNKEVKIKKQDYSSVNMDLIPEHIKRLILSKSDNDSTKEQA
jgi:hypothetical protein